MRYLIITLFLLLYQHCSSQISVAYYLNQSEISVSTHTEKRVWGEVRFATNTFFGNVTTEPILQWNIKHNTKSILYVGVGANLNFFNVANSISILNGYTFHVGMRLKPIQNVQNFQIIGEVSPYLNRSFAGGVLRTSIGIAYQFDRKTKKSS